jgi:hypothetical protein
MARIAVDGDVLSAIWKLKTTDTDLRIDVRPARFLEIFRGFTVPREIANGPSPCAGGR